MKKIKKKGLGTFSFVAIGLGAIVGVGWALYVNEWIARSGGPIPAVIGYALSTLMLIPIAMCYAEMSSRYKVSGGVSVYAYRAFGTTVGFISGFTLLVVWLFIVMWEALFFGDILYLAVPGLADVGSTLYSLGGVDVNWFTIIISIVLVIIFTALNTQGAHIFSKVQNVMLVILVGGGLLCVTIFVIKGDFGNLVNPSVYAPAEGYSHSNMFGGILACIVLMPFFMGGIDLIPQGIEDADPNADSFVVGKGLIISAIAAGTFYMVCIFACGVALPWKEFQTFDAPAAPNIFYTIFSDNPGLADFFFIFLTLTVLLGLLTTMNAFIYGLPRLMVSMTKGRLLPQWFGKIEPKTGTPRNATICVAVIVCIGCFGGMGVIEPLTAVCSFGYLICWALTTFSTYKINKEEPNVPGIYKVPGGKVTSMVMGCVCLALGVTTFIPSLPSYMGSLGMKIVLGCIAVGVIMYLFGVKERKSVSYEDRLRAIMND